ncbi:MAG: nickel pincer cofactor biosynthesis protein LarB [Candidatus Eisenbacteria bacterium]|nr:nickel pincer cofactor biosynthesis protein LarB [Candidatus Eisenbacteria bacterium]
MQTERLREILARVKRGGLGVEGALSLLRHLPFETVEESTIDHHRSLRCGYPEVVFCGGKTERQIVNIVEKMLDEGEPVLATRVDPRVAETLLKKFRGARHNAVGRVVFIRASAHGGRKSPTEADGLVLVVTAGTSDVPVAEEACATAEAMGCKVERVFDVGVAGIHRVISHRQRLWEADAIVAVAGMEGALPGVVAGLTDRPVVAVPTSVGYGASFGGVAALLGMLNSCASGVTVVNIDNGFGAGYAAALIARGKALELRKAAVEPGRRPRRVSGVRRGAAARRAPNAGPGANLRPGANVGRGRKARRGPSVGRADERAHGNRREGKA